MFRKLFYDENYMLMITNSMKFAMMIYLKINLVNKACFQVSPDLINFTKHGSSV